MLLHPSRTRLMTLVPANLIGNAGINLFCDVRLVLEHLCAIGSYLKTDYHGDHCLICALFKCRGGEEHVTAVNRCHQPSVISPGLSVTVVYMPDVKSTESTRRKRYLGIQRHVFGHSYAVVKEDDLLVDSPLNWSSTRHGRTFLFIEEALSSHRLSGLLYQVLKVTHRRHYITLVLAHQDSKQVRIIDERLTILRNTGGLKPGLFLRTLTKHLFQTRNVPTRPWDLAKQMPRSLEVTGNNKRFY